MSQKKLPIMFVRIVAATILCLLVASAVVDAGRHKDPKKSFKKPPHLHSKFAYVTYTKEKGYDIKVRKNCWFRMYVKKYYYVF